MKNSARLYLLCTWSTALAGSVMVAGLAYGILRFGETTDSNKYYYFAAACLLGFLSQTGLALSPVAIRRSLWVRAGTMLLMTPFLYFYLFHDLVEMFSHIMDRGIGSAVSDGFGMSYLVLTVWTTVYLYNIMFLVRGRVSTKDEKNEKENRARPSILRF
ncbi:MAG: hypothetical protein WBO10_08780 [Pyrinomonadaceae bacterium]